jgi:ABC-type transport system involved in cytochrome c biogenesis permease component
VLLGILTYPIVMPVLVAGTKGTAALLSVPAEPAAALVWLKLLLAFDLLFFFLSSFAFGPLVSGD